MHARILTAYHEVTVVKINYDKDESNSPLEYMGTRIEFTGCKHYERAHQYIKWINNETIS